MNRNTNEPLPINYSQATLLTASKVSKRNSQVNDYTNYSNISKKHSSVESYDEINRVTGSFKDPNAYLDGDETPQRSESSDSTKDRWDEAIFDKMDCK